jgi:hypothetical protein
VVQDALGPRWGLHLVDVNIALGNLVGLARDEAAAYGKAVSRRARSAAASTPR